MFTAKAMKTARFKILDRLQLHRRLLFETRDVQSYTHYFSYSKSSESGTLPPY